MQASIISGKLYITSELKNYISMSLVRDKGIHFNICNVACQRCFISVLHVVGCVEWMSWEIVMLNLCMTDFCCYYVLL